MTLETNLLGVLERTRRRIRDLDTARQQVVEPDKWREAMKADAARTLWALAKPEEWRQVDIFLAAVLTGKLADGFFSAMNNPIPPLMAVEDFAIVNDMQLKQLNTGKGPGLFSELMNKFDEMMADWVATEKRKDRRDDGKSDEEIGRWVGYLMLTPNNKLSAQELAAKNKLMPHIVDYLQRAQTAERLSTETVNAWLLAVLAGWRALVRREFPGRFAAELAAVRTGLN